MEKSSTDKKERDAYLSIRVTLRICMIVLIILFTIALIAMIFLPMVIWGYKTIVLGQITLGNSSGGMTYEDLITFAVSALSLLVAIITLGVGVMGVVGYIQIRKAAERKAEDSARKVINKLKEEVKQDFDNDVGLKFERYVNNYNYQKTIDELLAKKLSDYGFDKMTSINQKTDEVEKIKTAIGSIKTEIKAEENNG